MGGDLPWILAWWFLSSVLGVAALPWAGRTFAAFPDRGYAVSRLLGLILPAYLSWLLSSLGLVPFRAGTVRVLAAATAGASLLVPSWRRRILALRWQRPASLLLAEALFALPFLLWCHLRGLAPDLVGLEKFMDFGFVNAALRAETMPPEDPWFAGRPVNYYYFGHFLCAWLVRLSGVEPAVGYNLMIALLAGLTSALGFALGSGLVALAAPAAGRRSLAAGLLASLLLLFGGNLHPAVHGLARPLLAGAGLIRDTGGSYWYPDATRYVGYAPPTTDKTIHEFPAYSFVVADLHGHVSGIPLVLAFLALLASAAAAPEGRAEAGGGRRLGAGALAGGAFLLGLSRMTNLADFPVLSLAALVLPAAAGAPGPRDVPGALARSLLPWGLVTGGALLVSLPFSRGFEPFLGGVGVVRAQTPPSQFLVLWGFHLAAVALLYGELSRRERGGGGLAPAERLTAAMALLGLGLLLAPEAVYVRDIYGEEYHRANTMFKLTFAAVIILAPVAARALVGVPGLPPGGSRPRWVAAAATLAAALVLIYPLWSIPGYYGSLFPGRRRGLDGLSFLDRERPGEGEVVRWLREEVPGRPVVLEAAGTSYTDDNRFSMATGLPTVLGWFVHEWLWRNDLSAVTARREDVAAIYQAASAKEARLLLDRYRVRYLIVGEEERERYPGLREDTLASLGRPVLVRGGVTVYRIGEGPGAGGAQGRN